MGESSQEKTEEATPKRLREARKKGQVPKSRDVTQIFVMIIVFGVLCLTFAYMGKEFKAFFEHCFRSISTKEVDGALIYTLGKEAVLTFARALAPVLGAGFLTALVVGMAQVGAIFTGEPLKPQFNKLNPVEGVKNMFKVVTFIELIKNIAKIAVVLYIAYSTVYKSLDEVMATYRIDILMAAQITGSIIFEFVLKVCIIFLLISLFDYVIQRWNFMKNMRMTKDEVKREYKQDEGDPAIKGERRRLHREMAFSDAKQAVKKSDVVVTNPTHVACAIHYDQQEMSAPEVVISGQRKFAEMIVDIAQSENVPIVRNIPLAWSLLKLEDGDEIPEDLYEAVAEVLSLIYEMKESENDDGIIKEADHKKPEISEPESKKNKDSVFPF